MSPVQKHWTEIEWPNGVPPPVLRLRCAWCPDKAPMDGLGPIPDWARVSDGICAVCLAKALEDAHDER